MNIIKSFFSGLVRFISIKPAEGKNQLRSNHNDAAQKDTAIPSRPGDFDGDYRKAIALLAKRIDQRFPDNFHARVGANQNSKQNFGDERAEAIDTAYANIALALRSGSTVKQAADSGAISINI